MARPVHGGNLAWAAGLADCAPHELLDFSASISPLGPPLSVQEAVRAAFSSVVAYPDPAYGELRAAIAQHHQVSSDHVIVGNGAAELINWAARDLATLSQCFCLAPGFGDYARALAAFGRQITPVPLLKPVALSGAVQLTQWEMGVLAQGEASLAASGLLLNNPHNPTGALFGLDRLRALLPQLGLVVVDEAFMDFLPPDRQQSVIGWVGELPQLVVIRSLTKFYSIPGLRLGYAIAQPETLQRWRGWRDAWPVNVLAAAAGLAALQDSEFQQKTWQWLAAEAAQLYEGLMRLPGLTPFPSSANFFLVRCDVPATALQASLLQRHRLYIRDCVSFPELGDRYFRVAVKSRADNQTLLSALAAELPQLLCEKADEAEGADARKGCHGG